MYFVPNSTKGAYSIFVPISYSLPLPVEVILALNIPVSTGALSFASLSISRAVNWSSFSAALTICFFGIIIYSFGIISTVFLNSDASIITLTSGTVVEVISGLFFWLYVQASKQLDIYHKRLASTEKYLTAISLVDKMSEAEKDRQYEWIIRKIVMVDGENTLKNEENT